MTEVIQMNRLISLMVLGVLSATSVFAQSMTPDGQNQRSFFVKIAACKLYCYNFK